MPVLPPVLRGFLFWAAVLGCALPRRVVWAAAARGWRPEPAPLGGAAWHRCARALTFQGATPHVGGGGDVRSPIYRTERALQGSGVTGHPPYLGGWLLCRARGRATGGRACVAPAAPAAPGPGNPAWGAEPAKGEALRGPPPGGRPCPRPGSHTPWAARLRPGSWARNACGLGFLPYDDCGAGQASETAHPPPGPRNEAFVVQSSSSRCPRKVRVAGSRPRESPSVLPRLSSSLAGVSNPWVPFHLFKRLKISGTLLCFS